VDEPEQEPEAPAPPPEVLESLEVVFSTLKAQLGGAASLLVHHPATLCALALDLLQVLEAYPAHLARLLASPLALPLQGASAPGGLVAPRAEIVKQPAAKAAASAAAHAVADRLQSQQQLQAAAAAAAVAAKIEPARLLAFTSGGYGRLWEDRPTVTASATPVLSLYQSPVSAPGAGGSYGPAGGQLSTEHLASVQRTALGHGESAAAGFALLALHTPVGRAGISIADVLSTQADYLYANRTHDAAAVASTPAAISAATLPGWRHLSPLSPGYSLADTAGAQAALCTAQVLEEEGRLRALRFAGPRRLRGAIAGSSRAGGAAAASVALARARDTAEGRLAGIRYVPVPAAPAAGRRSRRGSAVSAEDGAVAAVRVVLSGNDELLDVLFSAYGPQRPLALTLPRAARLSQLPVPAVPAQFAGPTALRHEYVTVTTALTVIRTARAAVAHVDALLVFVSKLVDDGKYSHPQPRAPILAACDTCAGTGSLAAVDARASKAGGIGAVAAALAASGSGTVAVAGTCPDCGGVGIAPASAVGGSEAARARARRARFEELLLSTRGRGGVPVAAVAAAAGPGGAPGPSEGCRQPDCCRAHGRCASVSFAFAALPSLPGDREHRQSRGAGATVSPDAMAAAFVSADRFTALSCSASSSAGSGSATAAAAGAAAAAARYGNLVGARSGAQVPQCGVLSALTLRGPHREVVEGGFLPRAAPSVHAACCPCCRAPASTEAALRGYTGPYGGRDPRLLRLDATLERLNGTVAHALSSLAQLLLPRLAAAAAVWVRGLSRELEVDAGRRAAYRRRRRRVRRDRARSAAAAAPTVAPEPAAAPVPAAAAAGAGADESEGMDDLLAFYGISAEADAAAADAGATAGGAPETVSESEAEEGESEDDARPSVLARSLCYALCGYACPLADASESEESADEAIEDETDAEAGVEAEGDFDSVAAGARRASAVGRVALFQTARAPAPAPHGQSSNPFDDDDDDEEDAGGRNPFDNDGDAAAAGAPKRSNPFDDDEPQAHGRRRRGSGRKSTGRGARRRRSSAGVEIGSIEDDSAPAVGSGAAPALVESPGVSYAVLSGLLGPGSALHQTFATLVATEVVGPVVVGALGMLRPHSFADTQPMPPPQDAETAAVLAATAAQQAAAAAAGPSLKVMLRARLPSAAPAAPNGSSGAAPALAHAALSPLLRRAARDVAAVLEAVPAALSSCDPDAGSDLALSARERRTAARLRRGLGERLAPLAALLENDAADDEEAAALARQRYRRARKPARGSLSVAAGVSAAVGLLRDADTARRAAEAAAAALSPAAPEDSSADSDDDDETGAVAGDEGEDAKDQTAADRNATAGGDGQGDESVIDSTVPAATEPDEDLDALFAAAGTRGRSAAVVLGSSDVAFPGADASAGPESGLVPPVAALARSPSIAGPEWGTDLGAEEKAALFLYALFSRLLARHRARPAAVEWLARAAGAQADEAARLARHYGRFLQMRGATGLVRIIGLL
jgi:hypothetical protein